METNLVKLTKEHFLNGMIPYGKLHMESGPKAYSIWNPMESPAIYTGRESQGGQSVNKLLTSSMERNLGIGQT